MLGATCWGVGVLMVGLAAVGLQMDREARTNSAVAPFVPSVFRGYALETLARKAYAEQQYASGLAYSRELVLRRPVPAEGLSLLTKGLLEAKQREQALPVLLLAAQRGWRDRFTQRLMVASALQVDDSKTASQRLLALWRLGERDDQTMALTQDVMKMTNGFAQFRQGLNKTDTWAVSFLTWGRDNLPMQSIEDLSASLVEKHVVMDCRQLTNTVQRFAQTGNGRTAISVWSRLCSKGPVTSPSDFTFKERADQIGPFDWTYPDQAGLNSELVEDSGKVGLQYDYAEQISVILAKRFAALAAGSHTAKIDAEGSEGIEDRPRILRINCLSQNGVSTRVANINIGKQSAPFQVPTSGCVAQEVQLIVGRGSGFIRQVTID